MASSSSAKPSTIVDQEAWDSSSDDENADNFEDACDDYPTTMDLTQAMSEAQSAITCFFNNKFVEAQALMTPWASTSIYHATGDAVFAFLSATLTFDRELVAAAGKKLKHCMVLCNAVRKKRSVAQNIAHLVKKPNYATYTDLEAHAELCYAEVLLLRAILTFIEDEELMSFVKGSMKVRQCYTSYKECSSIMKERVWADENSKRHFESGVRMGIGSFNVLISLLPAKIIRVLEFVGFSGEKEIGLSELLVGSRTRGGLRNVLCVMSLLGYHLIVCYAVTEQPGDLRLCEEILERQLQIYPNGVWFLFFKGRLEFMKGNFEAAVLGYQSSWKSQTVWPQFHHICFWELLWVECMQLKWKEALIYSDLLLNSSKWSRTIYSYQKAALLCMLGDELTPEEKKECIELMKEAPSFKQRIAGKSLPMEKFVVRRCKKFCDQGNRLLLPAIELMYLWNLFKIFNNNLVAGCKLLKIIEAAGDNVARNSDDLALVFLLKGAVLRHLGANLQAMACFESLIGMKKQIKEELYLVPYAIVEIGLLCASMGDNNKAIAALEDARKNYTGYGLESRLHFRIHSALSHLKSGN